MNQTIYCIDTSSLIELKEYRPIREFPDLWKKIKGLIDTNRLVAPQEVFDELAKQDDRLGKWAKDNRKMFKKLDAHQAKIAAGILSKFPSLVDTSKETPDADPFLIALAVSIKQPLQREIVPTHCVIVTEEKPSYGKGKPKIPDVSNIFGVECIYVMNLLTKEQWKI